MSLILPSTLSTFHDMLDVYMSQFTGEFTQYRHHYITVMVLNHLYYCVSHPKDVPVDTIDNPSYEVLLTKLCDKNNLSQTEKNNIVNFYMYHQEEVSSKFQLCVDTIERNFTDGELLAYGV